MLTFHKPTLLQNKNRVKKFEMFLVGSATTTDHQEAIVSSFRKVKTYLQEIMKQSARQTWVGNGCLCVYLASIFVSMEEQGSLMVITTALIFTLPTPHNVFESRPDLILAQLGVLQGVAGRFGELDHRHFGGHLKHLRRHRQFSLSPVHYTLHFHFEVLHLRHSEIQLLGQ